MLEYDDYVTWADVDDLSFLLAHEMVHNWPVTGDRGEAVGEGPAWWVEGVQTSCQSYGLSSRRQ